jgi:hypothetical protein
MNKSNVQNTIPLDHTLHGYQNGHTLLASSIDLPTETKRQLLIMSDMSGASMCKGYEEYITGYPVKEIGCYALAKTWYAPEMTRPGCVWTQTILIRFTDLINVTDYEGLLSLFKRPEKEHDYSYFTGKLDLELGIPTGNGIEETVMSRNSLHQVIQSLYSDSNTPLFIESSNANTYEKLLLCIWLQQWPRLKRNFSFCTGSIGARSFNNKFLDLQVIPFLDALPKSEQVTFLNRDFSSDSSLETWSKVIVDDLYSPSSLRKFINSFGADVKATKKSFKSLSLVYSNLVPKVTLECKEMIDLLAREFADSNDAVSLKSFALDEYAEKRPANNKISGLENIDVLFELATTENFKAFDPNKLKLNEHLKELFEHYPEQVFEMFDRMLDSKINPLGVEMLREIAKRTGAINFDSLADKSAKVIQAFIHINPEIVYNDSFWNVGFATQQENLNVLMKPGIRENISWSRLLPVVLEKNISVDFETLSQLDFNVVDFLLSWSISEKGGDLSYRWKRFLQDHPQGIMEWLKNQNRVNKATVQILVDLLNPNARVVISYGTDIWQKILSLPKQDLGFAELCRLKAFTLAIGFNNSDQGARDLIVSSLEPVYAALLDNKLEYSSWQPIERHTKPLAWWNDWDKAKKLVIAVIEMSQANKWPAATFGKMFTDKRVADRFLSHYRNI